jgi:hypothetical protein
MIANFFQSLNARDVEYLLISGQATVLYGAATFSEDIDIWINPTGENAERLMAALRDCAARYYKLTPPLTVDNLQAGHGFHFVLPGRTEADVFLDVMGKPPRVGAFATALATARWMDTEWGSIRTIGIKPLVELKKTQRLEDYPIISKLALAWFAQPEAANDAQDFRWALQNIFTLPELTAFFTEHPGAVGVATEPDHGDLGDFGGQWLAAGDVPDSTQRSVGEWLHRRIAELQLADRHYWRDIIRNLKELRSAGELMIEGSEVRLRTEH